MTEDFTQISFDDLNLSASLMKALNDVGYESPSPIQAKTIPLVMAGKDLVGQAQTGTGKTAAFALPLLSRINLKKKLPQVLVLAPTRELAIQVAEAFQTYAKHIKGFHVLPIYGGQDYGTQLRPLKRGVHVVVGTPGRVMDHMRRGTLKLDALDCLVLDEADEMLRMGFIDDVEWILEQIPEKRQIVLFSATMPTQIRKIAKKYLQDPEQVTIKNKTATVETTHQRYWMVSGAHKLDALTRILEAENHDAVLIFVRTRISTVELAEKLQARGYAAIALNGDLQQKQRERTLAQLKSGKLDILVATDVAARGLDVDRISHVINYDIPNETEAYIHRIGRTGRAGRTGEAILFVTPREKHWLHRIERATRQKIEMMELPSTEMINDKRVARFKQNITDAIAREGLVFYQNLIEEYQQEHNVPATEIAAALAKMVQGKDPLL
ncbi:MAG: DEAD/DEAH box helicase, partial [Gammaproteobacteria bacterium]